MEKHLLTHRNLEHNEILLYSKHISSFMNLKENKLYKKNHIYESNDIVYLKNILLNILNLS
ncbi:MULTISPECIES: hypothetical protein [Paraclostridium]|uniref:Uncharacterized protein n=1 Tax=Paraclostridium benzoelyticum TaxID=1629550 RepID=A0A0M3DHK2_9FIRM|nr:MULTISPECIES: hypothetical protein [Paraclostridium]KKY01803.1 hypothetical protein VN21_07095 [Paraclostridium benzoelyticum]MCU9816215.1 hypothetical protein [Paraclostridium sp. AKS73]